MGLGERWRAGNGGQRNLIVLSFQFCVLLGTMFYWSGIEYWRLGVLSAVLKSHMKLHLFVSHSILLRPWRIEVFPLPLPYILLPLKKLDAKNWWLRKRIFLALLCPLFCSFNASWLRHKPSFTVQEILEHKMRKKVIWFFLWWHQKRKCPYTLAPGKCLSKISLNLNYNTSARAMWAQL